MNNRAPVRHDLSGDDFIHRSEAMPMAIYIALLRGINVSGHKLIKMAELRTIFASMGLQQVETYIQSGNVLANQLHKLDVPSTTRNWRTVKKLSAMAQAMTE